MTIRLSHPGATYEQHRDQLQDAALRVLESGWYVLGQESREFELELAEFLAVDHVVGVANGTDAVELALRGCGVGPGDLVVTVSHTAVATVAAIERFGAVPVLVDIEPSTMTIDLEQLEHAFDRLGARAAVVVHLYGHPVDMGAVMTMADRYGTLVVEDCAQAHGARWDGRRVGTFGHAAAFSFYPTKNLGTFGDGGAVATAEAGCASRVRSIRQYGWATRYVSDEQGFNSRLDELQAAFLRVLLPHLDETNELRRSVAGRYDEALATAGLALPPHPPPAATHVYHQYVVRTPRRDDLATHLGRHGIETGVLYPVPVHLQPAYRGRVRTVGDLRRTEQICKELLCLPIGPHIDSDIASAVADRVRVWADANR